MNKGKRSLKEEGQRALLRGDWKGALEIFLRHCAQEPKDLRSRLKVAELLEKLGQKKEAVQIYREVAESYAQDGFLLHAICVNKILLRIDSSAEDVTHRLTQLYTKKAGQWNPLSPVRHIPLFSELNEQELQSLLGRIQVKTFQEGISICQEGGEGDSLFIIGRGEVAIRKKMGREKEVWIRNLGEGDSFGEFGFFTDRKRHATVKAVTECEIFEISRQELNQMVRTYPRIRGVLQNLFKQRVLDLFLAFSPLFSSLTPPEREKVFKRFRLIRVPEEVLLFEGGDPPKSLYMIRSGEVEIFTRNREGRRVVLATLESGNFFGEIGTLLNRPRTASAKTTRPSELFELSREDFETCLQQFPKLRSAVKAVSLNRLVESKEVFSREEFEKVREAMV